MLKKIKGIIALSRWVEVYDFTMALSIISVLFAGGWAGTRLLAIVVANFLAMTYAFMINDVEDAEEDAEDPKKKLRNPICNGSLTKKEGTLVANLTLLISLGLFSYTAYVVASPALLVAGSATLLVSFLYSYRKIRLKAIPAIDVLTHMYMLSGSIFITSYLAFEQTFSISALAALTAVMFVSGYGQLDNEIRDFTVDSKTSIRTTATVIGKKQAILLQFILLAIAAVGFIFVGTRLVNVTAFLEKYLISFAALFFLPLLGILSGEKIRNKVWFHRALVISAAVAALWTLFVQAPLVN